MTNELLNQAITYFKAGNKTLARQKLAEVLSADPNNEAGWLWLAACVESAEQKKYALERALAINPHNQRAKTAIARLTSPPLPDISQITPSSPALSEHTDKPAKAPNSTASDAANSQVVHPTTLKNRVTPTARQRATKQSIALEWVILAVVALLAVISLGFAGFLLWPRIFNEVQTPLPTMVAAVQQSLSEVPPSTDQPVPSSTPEQVATASPRSAAQECRDSVVAYLIDMQPEMIEFRDALEVASSTPRIALGGAIQRLQDAKRRVEDIPAPSCARAAVSLVVRSMDNVISAFIDFMGDGSERLIERKLSQALLDLTNGTDQLTALAEGRPTPIPQRLPTDTPVPTPLPTSTPFPAGSSIVLEDGDGNPWQISVTRVEIAETLKSSYSDNVEKAAGRFAILFLSVTNRGLSPETFIAFATLDIQDSSGRKYEEHFTGSSYARDIYGRDYCVDVNPDATENCIAVFDISEESDYYLLVPGELADPYAPSVLLSIP